MLYSANPRLQCYICGNSPCVVVEGHEQPQTHLCGAHFWNDPSKHDPDTWNDQGDIDDERDTSRYS